MRASIDNSACKDLRGSSVALTCEKWWGNRCEFRRCKLMFLHCNALLAPSQVFRNALQEDHCVHVARCMSAGCHSTPLRFLARPSLGSGRRSLLSFEYCWGGANAAINRSCILLVMNLFFHIQRLPREARRRLREGFAKEENPRRATVVFLEHGLLEAFYNFVGLVLAWQQLRNNLYQRDP